MAPDLFIYNRLGNVEKMAVYSANSGVIAHMAQNNCRGDMILHNVLPEDREAVMIKVQERVDAEIKVKLVLVP